MNINKITKLIFILIAGFVAKLTAFDYLIQGKDFASSFVNHYDFAAEGRYTHEYHNYLLSITAKSLNQLENRLKEEGFNLHGHNIILGYEGGAIPSYYTDFRASKINDEAASLFKDGWSMQLHNRFGLMSGFLFKDLNDYIKQMTDSNNASHMKHINPEDIEIFNDQGGVLLEHAFGKALPIMQEYKAYVEEHFRTKNFKNILYDLVDFWNLLYSADVKAFNGGSSATQDILFSVSYAKHLLSSKLNILNFYTGGDITYPIEVFVGQKREATKNAQDFIKIFAPTLQAVNDQNTVYVFCSFVDGVGKSTMLGNIQNWLKFGDDVSKYERVDNSSSQYATLFEFKDKVFIADLPAQISHFTYKPDGLVYVPVQSEISADEIKQILEYVRENKENLRATYEKLYHTVSKIVKSDGFLAKELNDRNNPEYAFLKNIILLKKESANGWVPFEFNDTKYLFNYFEPSQIRILRSLSGAPSSGLKNIESEQMLFFDGVRFPFDYSYFSNDLVSKLKNQNIKNVVFVNFLSMYPRSSRENIRINYLMQQMALLGHGFSTEESLYKNFISPAQLYAHLLSPSTFKKSLASFDDEILVRVALFKILLERSSKDLGGISLEDLTNKILNEFSAMENSGLVNFVKDLSLKKFSAELKHLKHTFGLTKELINIQLFSFEPLISFSKELCKLFSETIQNNHLNSLWLGMDQNVVTEDDLYLGESDRIVKLEDDSDTISKFEFYTQCREELHLAPFMRMIRAAYYAAISNILYCDGDFGDKFYLNNIKHAVVPFTVTQNASGHIFCIQKLLESKDLGSDEEFQKASVTYPYTKFKVSISEDTAFKFGFFDGMYYNLNWNSNNTYSNIFAFGVCLELLSSESKESSIYDYADSIISNRRIGFNSGSAEASEICFKYKKAAGENKVLPTSTLYKELQVSDKWHLEKMAVFNEAKKNGFYKNDSNIDLEIYLKDQRKNNIKIYLENPNQRKAAQLCVRFLATLEMILKDPNSSICVRKGNQKDFIAALKLIEEIVLPKHFGLLFSEPLFDDYGLVDPVIPWNELQ